jgi:hypothetical protein
MGVGHSFIVLQDIYIAGVLCPLELKREFAKLVHSHLIPTPKE